MWAETGSVGLDPLGAETSRYLGPGELTLLTEPPLQHLLSPGTEQLVNAEIAIGGVIGDVDSGRGQRLDPPDVLWGHEVPCRAERMGPQDLSFVDEPVDVGVENIPTARSERPLCRLVVLSLHRPEPGHDRLWVGKGLPPEPAVAQPAVGDIEQPGVDGRTDH